MKYPTYTEVLKIITLKITWLYVKLFAITRFFSRNCQSMSDLRAPETYLNMIGTLSQ
jgi:hypothetical protein